MSYDFADKKKWRSKTKACRTVPESLRNELIGGDVSNDDFDWSKKAQKNNKKGLCSLTGAECDVCKFSWLSDREVETGRWKGFSAMARCFE